MSADDRQLDAPEQSINESTHAPAADPAFLPEALACLRCGYNLRGLRADGRCPECGASVEFSLHGDDLTYANPAWVQSLALGTRSLFWSILFTLIAVPLLITSVFFRGPGSALAWISVGLYTAGQVCACGGGVRLTRAEPNRRQTNKLHILRYLHRIALLAAISPGAALLVLFAFEDRPGFLIPYVFIGIPVSLVALPAIAVSCARRLARRLDGCDLSSEYGSWTITMGGTISLLSVGGLVAVGPGRFVHDGDTRRAPPCPQSRRRDGASSFNLLTFWWQHEHESLNRHHLCETGCNA